jgi:hypothetical protein
MLYRLSEEEFAPLLALGLRFCGVMDLGDTHQPKVAITLLDR